LTKPGRLYNVNVLSLPVITQAFALPLIKAKSLIASIMLLVLVEDVFR
jgi:hypothetical protein